MSIPLEVDILEGNFTIKHTQNLYVDNVLTQVVLSGIFSFKAMIVEDKPTSFLTGRFDMGYGDEFTAHEPSPGGWRPPSCRAGRSAGSSRPS